MRRGGEREGERGKASLARDRTYREMEIDRWREEHNGAKLRGLGILLPETTPTNRSRTRNENGWCYIACQWEKLVALQKKAIGSGVSVDDLLRASNEKERQHQKRKCDKDKAKKTAAPGETYISDYSCFISTKAQLKD